jgi:acyl-CoA thioesterase FadM
VFPWLRLFRVLAGLISQEKVQVLETTRVRLRVWPHDLDFNFHVNNGRYLALADIGRMHRFVRTGLLGVARRQRAYPVVGDAIAKFRRELRVFQTFEIHTRLVGWDGRWGVIEHRFVRARRVLGTVTIRGVFKGPSGPVEPAALLKDLSFTGISPELPDWVTRFQQSSELSSESLREEERAQGLRG